MDVPTWVTVRFYKNSGDCVKCVLHDADKFNTYDLSSVTFDYIRITIIFDELQEFDGDIEELVGRVDIWFHDTIGNIVGYKSFKAYGSENETRCYDNIKSCECFSLAYRVKDYS